VIHRQKTEILLFSLKSNDCRLLIAIFALISPQWLIIRSVRAVKHDISPGTKARFNITLTYKSHMDYRFCWSVGCFFNISLKVIIVCRDERILREKSRRQLPRFNAIIPHVFSQQQIPEHGLRKAKDYFYEA